MTLIEYWIPYQNKLWGKVGQCGISNALQFDVDRNNDVWFSEWSKKMGRVLTDRVLPITVSVLPNLTLQRKGMRKLE